MAAAVAAADDTEQAGNNKDPNHYGGGNQCPAGPWGWGEETGLSGIWGQQLPPTGRATPTHLLEVPRLTGDPGNEVWNEPGYSRGARRGWGAGGCWGGPHLPALLAWNKWPGWPGRW